MTMADKSHTMQCSKKKARTNKILDRLTYNPPKHKNKFTRSLRDKLEKRRVARPTNKDITQTEVLKIASMNVDGLDYEATEAIMEFLQERKYDVSLTYKTLQASLYVIQYG